MNNLLKEAWNYLEKTQTVYMATVEEKKPRIRPVTLIYFDNQLWIATSNKDAEHHYLQNNSEIEICLPIKGEGNSGYLRVYGTIELIQEHEPRKFIADNVDFIKKYWEDPDNHHFTLIHFIPEDFDYLPLGKFVAEHIHV